MTVMDRYVTLTFFKIFAICLICLTGLFVVVDVFSNLEEFIELGQKSSGMVSILIDYYAPRALEIFDRTGALLALTAAIGTLVWMQRYNELAAIEAGGICKSRVVRPILGSALILVGLSIVNRELVIPRFRESLARSAQSWDGTESQSISPVQDQETAVWILSGKVTPANRTITQPEFRLPTTGNAIGAEVAAEMALGVEANADHPSGFLLKDVKRPIDIGDKPSIYLMQRPFVLTAYDQPWLQQNELFIASNLSLNDIAYGPRLRRFSSVIQQVAELRNASVWSSHRQRVEVHSRVIRPVVDFSILLIGLPLVVSRRDRNIFVALGVCLLVVLGIQVLIIGCQWLGAYRIIGSAALAAWLPAISLFPLGFALQVRLEQ